MTRLVAATLLVSLPAMIVMALLLTSGASSSLTDAADEESAGDASAVTQRVEEWLGERNAGMGSYAKSFVNLPPGSGPLYSNILGDIATGFSKAYTVLEVVNLDGTVFSTSDPKANLEVRGQAWFRTAAGGEPVLTSISQQGERIRWVIAYPILGVNGRVERVMVGGLRPEALADLVALEVNTDAVVAVVGTDGKLIYQSTMGAPADDKALLAAGSLQTTLDNPAVKAGRDANEPAFTRFTDAAGVDTIAGYDRLDDLNWVVLSQHPADIVLAPVTRQRQLALALVAASLLLVVGGSIALGRWITRPVRQLTAVTDRATAGDFGSRVTPAGADELVTLGQGFNQMLDTCQRLISQAAEASTQVNAAASQLSTSSDELAATTTQQSAAIVEATSTTEELARASIAIADTVDEVARQTAETRDNLEQAEADIMTSSERTLSLANRVSEIDRLLDLINGIADQTNLLALNAAIEAARAGENGRGFAVVADEVRRLAESSKASAGDITLIVSSVQTETNATVMAMEKGAKQLQQGLSLLDAVTEANGQVRLTTQQQRSATAQVVETMEQLTDASRQVSSTAQELSSAANRLAGLASTLEATDELTPTGG